MARKRLGEILIQSGLIDDARLRMALREQQRWGGPLGRKLIELRLVREDDLVRALSMQLNIPVAPDLLALRISPDTLDLLPTEFCEEHALIPFHQEGKFLDLALCDPTNLSIVDEVRIRTKLNVRPHLIGPNQLERAFNRHYKGLDLVGRPAAPGAPGPGSDGNLRYVDFKTEVTPPPHTLSPPPTTGILTAPPGPSTPAPMTAVTSVPLGPPHEEGVVDAAAFEQLQRRVTELEAFLARDESVLRKLLGLLVENRVVSREQILACLQD